MNFKLIRGGSDTPDVSCTIKMDNEIEKSTDFVAFMYHADETRQPSFYMSCDAITLGQAIQVMTKSFAVMIEKSTEEEKELIKSALTEGTGLFENYFRRS